MASEPLIHMREVVFSRSDSDGGFLLNVPEFAVMRGECVACIGPSGSGKTTLLHLISGVIEAAAGTIHVLGKSVATLSDAQRRRIRLEQIGMIFQEFELLEYIDARSNMVVHGHVSSRVDRAALIERANALATATGVAHILDHKPQRMSQGERQRVAICRALVTQPPVILGDEPTGNLDPIATSAVIDLLINQARSAQAALVVATHNHSLLDRFDRVVDMSDYTRRRLA